MVKIKELLSKKYLNRKNLTVLYKIVLALFLLLVIYYCVNAFIHRNDSSKVSAKIDQYVKAQDCQKGVEKLSSEKSGYLNTDAKIKLYNYQKDCYAVLSQYSSALDAAGKLRSIYVSQGRNDLVELQDNAIENIKAKQAESQNEKNQPKGNGHDTKPVL